MIQSDRPTAGHAATTRWLMLAILAWGLLLALGTFLFGGNQPLLRAAIVAGCTLAFLALWIGALAVRRRRSSNS
jgi:high-affinity Fe2+/Pb2+ permease